MRQPKTETIKARITQAEAEKLRTLAQCLGAPSVSEALRTLIAGANIESRIILTVNLPTNANSDAIRQDSVAVA